LIVLSATWTTCFAFSQNLEKSHIKTRKLTIAFEKCLDIIPWMALTALRLLTFGNVIALRTPLGAR
jgi:hypothetical protein